MFGAGKKSAPPYAGKAVPQQFISSQTDHDFGSIKAQMTLKSYPPDILLAELSFEVPNIFADEIFDLREMAIDECITLLKDKGGKEVETWSEEYTVFVISDYGDKQQDFLAEKNRIASLLKSEKLKLDTGEVEHTFQSSIKYESNDMVIVDWDGAFIFSPRGEYGEDLQLIQHANMQLLRYRLLDKDLESRLKHAVKLIKTAPSAGKLRQSKILNESLQEIIGLEARSISEFHALEHEVKLIGDWYSARLYDLFVKKFKFEEWIKDIKEKLESLEDFYTIAAENLGFSRTQVLETIQIWAFFVLQIGWFALIILEFFYFTR